MSEHRKKEYQRKHLRAPYKKDILFVDEDFVFKAQSLNLSEGGLLLDRVGHFPVDKDVHFMIDLPQYPSFKNYTLDKLEVFSNDLIDSRTIRFKARMVRKIGLDSKIDGMLASKIGLKFTEINPFHQAKISSYVELFSSNLIYLQVLIDNINSDKNNIAKIRIISQYLGYDSDMKISYLRKIVENDYQSLQWL